MQTIKEYIKTLSEEQIVNKQARKTGTLPEWPRTSWGDVDYDNVSEVVKKSWRAAGRVFRDKVRITAALNIYHEIRGTKCYHNVPEGTEYLYDRDYQELKNQYRK